ncbi:hypothetical protein C2W62_18700 [Candidatus Entotheonella serta]|nr:hypothetical protein C2W62_18700 [Candidatus Entotheonella serta]
MRAFFIFAQLRAEKVKQDDQTHERRVWWTSRAAAFCEMPTTEQGKRIARSPTDTPAHAPATAAFGPAASAPAPQPRQLAEDSRRQVRQRYLSAGWCWASDESNRT